MVNEETDPTDDAVQMDEYYVPATFQFSRGPGRIERILVGLFDERGEIEARSVTGDSMPEFYVPAMFQFSTDPGRIERFLQALFEGADEEEPLDFPEEFVDDFYLPAANPDEFSRPGEGKHAPLVPASEASPGRGKPGEPGD